MKKRRELQIVKELSPGHDVVKTLRGAGFSVKRVVGLAERPVISERSLPSSVEGKTMNQLIAQLFGKARQSRLEEAPRAESAAKAGREEKAIAAGVAAEENPGSKEQQRFASSLQLALRASRTKGRAAAAEAMEPVSPAAIAAAQLPQEQAPYFFAGAGPKERYKRPQLTLPGVGFHGVGKHDAGVRRRMLLELKEVHGGSEDNRDRVG